MKIKRLLLVEDCDEDLKLLMHSLEKGQQSDAGSQPGVVYDTASSLSEAIAYLSEGKPDVIISDLNLPDSQGLATISSLLDATGAPIIAVTSISERHVAEEAVRSGAQEYIEKDSLNPARVWRCIRHAIDRKDIQNERDEMRAVLEEKRRFETLGRFAGGIAHDINNRLGIIRGTTQMLTAEDCSPQMTEDLSLIMAETDRVANLIQQLVQAGGEDDRVSCAALNLTHLIQASRTYLLHSKTPGITMTIETDAVPLVETSELHVRQILQNLVRNACEAIEDKGSSVDGHVTIVCRQEGASVVIAVTDTGAGIPEEIQSRMFDPYYTSRKSQGHSGLGLAIVQGIMKRSNGTLDFETSSGGTTFTCRFPVATNATPAEPGPTSSDPVATQATNPPVGSTGSADKNDKPLVLLADDEKSLLMLMTHLLAKAGCEVVTAFDGVDAMEHFMENPDGFDLVVSDVLMPRRNGAQLIHDILAKRPELPVLLVSGYTDGLLSEPWFDPNVPIMNKPFDLSEFRSQVEKMLYA